MKMIRLAWLATPALLLVSLSLPVWPQANAISPVADRRKALNDLFHEYWEANLEHSPEFASSIGDKRYNDKISDFSVKAFNDWLATEQTS